MLVYDPSKIVSLREGKGWNQAELARRAKLSQPSVWALEKGVTRMPKFETLHSIARALAVPIQDILAARPKGKRGEDWDAQLTATYDALDDGNKATLMALAQTLLNQQKRR
jgi:transcriptional regulator with XRE-family HTH domain